MIAPRAEISRRTLVALTALGTITLFVWAHAGSLSTMTGLAPIFTYLFAVGDHAALAGMLAIVMVASLVPSRYCPRPLLLWLGSHPGWLSAGAAAAMSCGSWWVYRHAPLSMDEYSAYFQSRVFAAGSLAGHFPPPLMDWLIPRGFQNYFLNVTPEGRVTSAYWPSFALLLTPFVWLRIPWVCNAVLSALTLVAVHRLALRIYGDRESAGLALLLTAASPVFFADGISYYSMPAHLLANTVYALLLLAPTMRRAWLAGLVGSVALTLHNPVPHLLFALPWIVTLVLRGRGRSGGLRLGLALIAGYLPLCLLLGVGWYAATSPHGGDLGIGGLGARAAPASINLPFAWPTSAVWLARLIGIAKLWAWAVPGLIVLAVAGAVSWRRNLACRLLTMSALLTLAGYIFVPFDQGHGWGYRYFHAAWMALPILAVAALRRPYGAAQWADRALVACAHGVGSREPGSALTFVVACALLSLIAGSAQRAVQMSDFIASHRKQMPAYTGSESRVVILNTGTMFYGRDLVQNDPWLRDSPIIMITHGTVADADMMRVSFPQLHRVYADTHGSVWSAVKP